MWKWMSVIVMALSLGGACAGDVPEVPVGTDGELDSELVLGRTIYQQRCATCHGSAGGGGAGPKLSDGEVIVNYPDPEAQRAIIAQGKNGMPSFEGRLSSAELDAVVRYTREVLE